MNGSGQLRTQLPIRKALLKRCSPSFLQMDCHFTLFRVSSKETQIENWKRLKPGTTNESSSCPQLIRGRVGLAHLHIPVGIRRNRTFHALSFKSYLVAITCSISGSTFRRIITANLLWDWALDLRELIRDWECSGSPWDTKAHFRLRPLRYLPSCTFWFLPLHMLQLSHYFLQVSIPLS